MILYLFYDKIGFIHSCEIVFTSSIRPKHNAHNGDVTHPLDLSITSRSALIGRQ